MPMYLDRHDQVDASAEAVALAHLRDLDAQGQHGVHYHTYWFDPQHGTLFCLAEGPNRAAVEDVHREAHGMLATSVIELDSTNSLNSFMGAAPSYEAGTAYEAPAMRAIVFTDICGSVAQVHELGDDAHVRLLREHDEIVRSELASQSGREVKHTGDGIMAAFISISACLSFAIQVQRRVQQRNAHSDHSFDVSIGISVGEPVTGDNDDLFGAAVQLAARLCAHASPSEITVSLGVHELSAGKSFNFSERGELVLKGLPDPVRAFSLEWSA